MLPIFRIVSVGGVSLAIVILVLALSPPGEFRPPLAQALMPARGALIAGQDHPEWRQFLIEAAFRRADELTELRQLDDIPMRRDVAKPDRAQREHAQPAIVVAGLPASQNDAPPQNDVTGSIAPSPDKASPVDIGESSSTELTVIPHPERPPVIMMPAHNEPRDQGVSATPEPLQPEPVKPAPASASLNVETVPAPTHQSAKLEKPARESVKVHEHRPRRAQVTAKVTAKATTKAAAADPFNPLAALFGIDTAQQTAKPRH